MAFRDRRRIVGARDLMDAYRFGAQRSRELQEIYDEAESRGVHLTVEELLAAHRAKYPAKRDDAAGGNVT